MLGEQSLGDDALLLDFGNGHTGVPRAYFRDGGDFSDPLETPSAIDATNWIYTAVSVDLTNSLMTLHVYNFCWRHTNTKVPSHTALPVSGWNLSNPLAVDSLIRIGEGFDPGQTMTLDEFSIDDVALSSSAIAARVASMVGARLKRCSTQR